MFLKISRLSWLLENKIAHFLENKVIKLNYNGFEHSIYLPLQFQFGKIENHEPTRCASW